MTASSLPTLTRYTQGSILKATAILGSGSFGTILVGLATAKTWAILVGPGGIGHAALLQGVAGLAGSIAGIGLATSVVRHGPALLASGREAEFDAMVRAAWSIWRYGVLAAAAIIVLLSNLIAGCLGGDVSTTEVMLVSIMVAATSATGVQNAVINAHHQVAMLARVSVLGILFGSIISLTVLVCLGASAIVVALIGNTLGMFLVSFRSYRRIHRPSVSIVQRDDLRRARRDLLRFGVPIAASILLGTGVQYILPALIANVASQVEVGCFRAASTIAITYVGFLLAALGQDYYPRLAAMRGNPTIIATTLQRQFRFTVSLGTLLAIIMLATSQWVIPLCYSRQFAAAAPLLDWLMLGMIFKMASWCLAFVMLTYCPGWVTLLTETASGVVWFTTSWIGLRTFGLPGLGMAFMATYAVYTLLVACVLSRYVGWILGRRQWFLLVLMVGFASGLFAVKFCWT